MALKKCRECGYDVSTEAEACPNCGVPDPTREEKKKSNSNPWVKPLLWVTGIALIGVVCAQLATLGGDANTPQVSEDLSLRQNVVQVAAREIGSDQLRGVSVEENGEFYTALVDFEASDNLTTSYVRNGMLRDVMDVIQSMTQHTVFDSVQTYSFRAFFPLVDDYGNSELAEVGQFSLDKAVADQIDWENMHRERFERLLQREGTFQVHPATNQ